MQSAKAVSTAARIYRSFPDATIDVRVLQGKLWQAQWVREAARGSVYSPADISSSRGAVLPSLQTYRLSTECAFGCITMFEPGHYDPNPAELSDVMAMSSGDSLYVGAALISDPFRGSPEIIIERTAGNIGRPGIVFLTPPVAPLMKEVSIHQWPQLGSVEFDGEFKDCFKSTSLHLSFTGASTPINVGFSGAQDADVYMLETLESVHDGGKWVADLNVLKAYVDPQLSWAYICQHHGAETSSPSYDMRSIESWPELLDELDDECICLVQAHGNWEVRLAACSISIAKGYPTIIASYDKVCWDCLNGNIGRLKSPRRPLVVIL